MKKRPMLVDVKVYDLAKLFLEDVEGVTSDDVVDLSEAIQRTIEDHIRYVRGEPV
jgi:hypothetical protein